MTEEKREPLKKCNVCGMALHFICPESTQSKKISELEKERDLAREMLISDQTHAPCRVFEENQRKKIESLQERAERSREAIETLHGEQTTEHLNNYAACRYCSLIKEALSQEEEK